MSFKEFLGCRSNFKFPELFFGFVAPIGSDLTDTLAAFRSYFTAQNYKVIELKVTDIFQFFKNYCPPTDESKPTPLNERYETHIQYGNQLRETLGDDVLASSIIYRISNRRVRRNIAIDQTFSRSAYLLSHSNGRKNSIFYGLSTDNFSFKFQSFPVVAPGSITFQGDSRTAKIRLQLRILGPMQKRSANATRTSSISRTGNESRKYSTTPIL
jgi:hypothetical protein